MKKKYYVLISLCFICAIIISDLTPINASNEPVALIVNPSGNVFYSHDGKKWISVKRNKFLFNGDHVKTENMGNFSIVIEGKNVFNTLKPESHIKIQNNKVKLIEGKLIEGESMIDLMSNLKRKFNTVHKYTVVLRTPIKKVDITIDYVSEIVLSKDFSDLVWENLGPEYSYYLIVDNNLKIDIPGSSRDLIRYQFDEPLTPGIHKFGIEVLHEGKLIYKPNNLNRLRWMTDKENDQCKQDVQSILNISKNNFLAGTYLEEKGLTVAAMDKYHEFFKKNPYENEIRPFLIKIYSDLKLIKLRDAENKLYNSQPTF